MGTEINTEIQFDLEKHFIDNNNDSDIISDELLVMAPTTRRWDPLGAADNDDIVSDEKTISYESDSGLSCPNELSIKTGYNITSSSSPCSAASSMNNEKCRIRNLEEEQEKLTTSLMALTSHFAQVQFRLRQIVETPPTKRDELLKNLEEFAFRGIPEITGNLSDYSKSEEVITNLVNRLKKQLTELEKFAYESGVPVLPQSIMLEKQKILIDELKNKLHLNLNEIDLPQLSSEELKNEVETAIGEFVGPLKMKEQLVAQLKTQITDLERFIAFLQYDSDEAGKLKFLQEGEDMLTFDSNNKNLHAYNTYSAKKKNPSSGSGLAAGVTHGICKMKGNTINHSNNKDKYLMKKMNNVSDEAIHMDKYNYQQNADEECNKNHCKRSSQLCANNSSSQENMKSSSSLLSRETNNRITTGNSFQRKAYSILDKASTILEMFAITEFGCGSNRFEKNTLKRSSKINHYGDIRAQLEVDIQEVLAVCATLQYEREKPQKSKKTKLMKHQGIANNARETSEEDFTDPNDDARKACQNAEEIDLLKQLNLDEVKDDYEFPSSSFNGSNNCTTFSTVENPITRSQNAIFNLASNSSSSNSNIPNQNNKGKIILSSNNHNYSSSPSASSFYNYYNYNSIISEKYALIENELTVIIRKNFSVTLQKLIQHGLRNSIDTGTSLIVPFIACFNPYGGGFRNGKNSSDKTCQMNIKSNNKSSSRNDLYYRKENNNYHRNNQNKIHHNRYYNRQPEKHQQENKKRRNNHSNCESHYSYYQSSSASSQNSDTTGIIYKDDDDDDDVDDNRDNFHYYDEDDDKDDQRDYNRYYLSNTDEEIDNDDIYQMHAWELILQYYTIKNGEQYNDTPARKLSESFNLDIIGNSIMGNNNNNNNNNNHNCNSNSNNNYNNMRHMKISTISNKESLLSTIGHIIAIHSPYKRSYNSHFKAFICAGLNSKKLVPWLNLIFQCNELISTYYVSWSYAARTGFRDALRSIDRLMKYDFNLPVDLAIRQFQNIKDVFM